MEVFESKNTTIVRDEKFELYLGNIPEFNETLIQFEDLTSGKILWRKREHEIPFEALDPVRCFDIFVKKFFL